MRIFGEKLKQMTRGQRSWKILRSMLKKLLEKQNECMMLETNLSNRRIMKDPRSRRKN